MALRIRRGTNAQRTGKTFEMGEIVYTTDSQQMWVGDGSTQGGIPVVGSNIAGYGLTYNNTSNKIQVAGLTADDITNGLNNKFFSTELAQDAAASLFTAGSHTNISFAYDDTLGKLNATVTLDGIGLTDIVNDTSPSLGGDLDINSQDIIGTGNINITGNIDNTGNITTTMLVADTALSSPIVTITDTLNVDNINSISATGVKVSADATTPLVVTGVGTLSPSSGQVYLAINAAKGTLASPTTSAAGDVLGGIVIQGYTGGEAVYKAAGLIAASWDSGATLSDASPKSSITFASYGGGTTIRLATFDNRGIFSAPIFKVSNVSGSLPSPAEAGMIVLDGTTFKGYNGSDWVNLN